MQREMEVTRGLNLQDLKSLVDARGPCLTMFVPIEKSPNTLRVEEIRSRSLTQTAERLLAERGVDSAVSKELLAPMPALSADRDQWGTTPGGTLVVLRSMDTFRAFEVGQPLEQAIRISKHFQIRPFFRSLQEDRLEFYLLALSQKHIRLLRCTPFQSVGIPLPKGIPHRLEEWLNTYQPNMAVHRTEGESPEPGPAGSFTSTHDRDRKDEFVQNYYRVINKCLTEMFTDESVPMILCGTDEELAMYRSVNSYATLVEDGVQGSPESLKGGELHRRALDIAKENARRPLRKALELFENLGAERITVNPAEIVKAAYIARIAFLFVSDDGNFQGRFDEESLEIKQDGEQEDLLNFAALKTIGYGGELFITDRASIPGKKPMAAIFRF